MPTTGSRSTSSWAPPDEAETPCAFWLPVCEEDPGYAAAYEIIEHEAALVAELFTRYANTGVTLAHLARWLGEQGALTRTGKTRRDRSTVWAMLRNPAYAGRVLFGKAVVINESPA